MMTGPKLEPFQGELFCENAAYEQHCVLLYNSKIFVPLPTKRLPAY